MADYISREAAVKLLTDLAFEASKSKLRTIAKCVNQIELMHAADVQPVRHGRWGWFDEDTGTPLTGHEREWGWRCSCCMNELPDDYDNPDIPPKIKYCSNCGAEMNEGAENAVD